eukprot:364928-Chlamydomonas_euryale.AAC.4
MAMHYDGCCKETRVHFGEKQQQAYGDGLIRKSMASEYYSVTLQTLRLSGSLNTIQRLFRDSLERSTPVWDMTLCCTLPSCRAKLSHLKTRVGLSTDRPCSSQKMWKLLRPKKPVQSEKSKELLSKLHASWIRDGHCTRQSEPESEFQRADPRGEGVCLCPMPVLSAASQSQSYTERTH